MESFTIVAPRPWGPIPPPPKGHTWENLMGEAICQAQMATSNVSSEIPVGAVIVSSDGDILSKASNQCITRNDPTAHAEICAIRMASKKIGNYRLNGCVLIVTLEPCMMCAGSIIHARLDGVVYGASDMKAGVLTSCFNAFDVPFINHRPWHFGGVRSSECAEMLHSFFYNKRDCSSLDKAK